MYKYGMRHRGFAPMCQPREGFDHREDDITGKYYDIIVYNRKLSDKEIHDYELEEIPTIMDREEKLKIYEEIKRSYIEEDIYALLEEKGIDSNLIPKEYVQKMINDFINHHDWTISDYDQLNAIVDYYID